VESAIRLEAPETRRATARDDRAHGAEDVVDAFERYIGSNDLLRSTTCSSDINRVVRWAACATSTRKWVRRLPRPDSWSPMSS
jgi:hypothetical protein